MESVLSQKGDFEIEYVIADGGSTDNTIALVKEYEAKIKSGHYSGLCNKITFKWFSEKDRGMYDAITKGLEKTTGDIQAYINADDMYLAGAFQKVIEVLNVFPDIEWLKGINTTGDESGKIIESGSCLIYRQDWIEKGIYGRYSSFIHQDSVFWKKSLWDKAKPNIQSYRLAGDYAIWIYFSRYAKLWSFNKQVSVFRRRPGQLSLQTDKYRAEQEQISKHSPFVEKRLLLHFYLRKIFKLSANNILARITFILLFPLHCQEWYIDFDSNGKAFKVRTTGRVV